MSSNRNRRFLMLTVAVAVTTLVSACSVTTGGFSPSRSPNTNNNLKSRYGSYQSQSMMSSVHSMMRTTSAQGGYLDHVYY